MEDKIINIIYDNIKNYNFYNYDNDKKLENVCINEYTNIEGNKVIDVSLEHETYTITCFKSYADSVSNRICKICGKPMTNGFYNEDEFEYYCSEECLHKDYTEEEYNKLYDDGNGNFYWTEWED